MFVAGESFHRDGQCVGVSLRHDEAFPLVLYDFTNRAGISRHDDSGTHESVSWNDLTEVSVVTTIDAPEDDEDVHLVLRGKAGSGVVIPHTLAVESGVLTELQLRLSEFDNQAFLDAMMSAVNNVFVLWRAPVAVLAPLRTASAKHAPLTFKTAG